MKTRHLVKYLIISACIAAAATSGGCGGGGGSSGSDDRPVNDESPDNQPPAEDPRNDPPPQPDPGSPNTPEGLAATAQSSGSIQVTWRDRANDETGFVVERSATSATGGFDPPGFAGQ